MNTAATPRNGTAEPDASLMRPPDGRTAIGECLVRLPIVVAKVGVAKSTLYKLIAEGKFPQPYRISSRLSVWDLGEIEAWIAQVRVSRNG